jgi:hypothetical protein
MRIPESDDVVMSGMMCPVSTLGSPGITMSQMCVDLILRPSGSLTVMGFVALRLFWHGAPFVKKKEVAPVSAMVSDGPIIMPKA